jgi:hypothetical protein
VGAVERLAKRHQLLVNGARRGPLLLAMFDVLLHDRDVLQVGDRQLAEQPLEVARLLGVEAQRRVGDIKTTVVEEVVDDDGDARRGFVRG